MEVVVVATGKSDEVRVWQKNERLYWACKSTQGKERFWIVESTFPFRDVE